MLSSITRLSQVTNQLPGAHFQKKAIKIFLSYVRDDKQKVAGIYKRLSEEGYSPWMDQQDLLAGECWRQGIERAIKEADFFVVCISQKSLKRGFFQREIKNALEIWREKFPSDIYLIPLRLEECKIHESLSEFQWVNLFEPNGWVKLLQSLAAGIERRECTDQRNIASTRGVVNIEELGVRESQGEKDCPCFGTLDQELPLVTFPRELATLLHWLCPQTWETIGDELRRFLVTIGTKFEPIVQIVPATPVPMVIGFECLALGSLGENFSQICKRAEGLDPGCLRLLTALAGMKAAESLRIRATESGRYGARHLLFSVNLDPEMINCSGLQEFLKRYRHLWESQVLFEVSEKTTASCLRRLRELQVDYDLRYCADDYNAWCLEAKQGLERHVELSKVDCHAFRNAMELRVIDPEAALNQLRLHKIDSKPMVVEGLEKESHLTFLESKWASATDGNLFGQGYFLKPGQPWDIWTVDLQEFNLPGGHILNRHEADVVPARSSLKTKQNQGRRRN